MFIGIVLLLGMMKIFFSMEPIPADINNNPFINNRLVVGSACIPMMATAPCNGCVQNDEIIAILKNKNLIPKDFEKNNTNFQTSLLNALGQKAISNQKAQLASVYQTVKDSDNFVELAQKVDNIYKNYLEKEDNVNINEFLHECLLLVNSGNKNKSKPWTLSQNLNNAFSLICNDIDSLIFKWSSTKAGLTYCLFVGCLISAVMAPRFSKNCFIASSVLCSFYKGLFSHSAYVTYVPKSSSQRNIIGNTQSICPCHNKENNTFKCAYRWIYCGLGSLLFLYIFFKRA